MVNSANIMVKQCITEALLRLMQKKSFQQISISEITRIAGVGRVSFYRNYQSKEDILYQYLLNQFNQHFQKISSEGKIQTTRDIFVNIFAFLKSCYWMLSILYEKDSSSLLLNFIKNCCGANPEQDNNLAYKNALIMGVVFGAVDEWIRRGCMQTPDEMADKVEENLKRILENWK
ncbi:TetR/AcrR family transcriptional regulator [uncultured Actinobacillus sp.]|uniref:TetR/AcrR family transcriptional regulator n=1 Tax=uncultured Actinobacillus sp. TaxID=417616 RepID=UPI0025CE69DA|nr:TetR/AcrR family transcriptional regulator [uncultured Actinobacillus sp.]